MHRFSSENTQAIQSQFGKGRIHPRLNFKVSGEGTLKILLLLGLHAGLALLMESAAWVSTVHAVCVLILAVREALRSKDLKRVIPYAAYFAGAEVLWRMTEANVFWEYSKYATVLVLVVALIRHRKLSRAGLPVFYFLFLIPSIFLTVAEFGWVNTAKDAISFNLSGPLTLSVCLLFFSQIKVGLEELKKWIWPLVYPVFGILTLALKSTLSSTEIYFSDDSNFVTSGGFGPNQVSAILGLGAFLLFMLAMQKVNRGERFWAIVVGLALLAQSLLTFSRGGVVNVVVSLLLVLVHLMGAPEKFFKWILAMVLIGSIGYFFLFPSLDIFTGGAFETRYTNLDTTGRLEISQADIQLWLKHPLAGVGPGLSAYFRPNYEGVAAHTEYTRVLADHGILGILSFLCLFILLARAYFQAPGVLERAWMVGLAAWPLVEMATAAMRIDAIPFMLGLAVIGWQTTTQSDPARLESRKLR